MTPLPGQWNELPARSFADLPAQAVALLPLGATEQHGPHLPCGVDSMLTRAVMERALAALPAGTPVLVLPMLEITCSGEHDAWAGTLSLSPEAMLQQLNAIGSSVARSGVGRLFMLNGHGGNAAILQVAARELRRAHGLVAAQASWFAFADLSRHDPARLRDDLHAGFLETAAMLAIRPELVDTERAAVFPVPLSDWASQTPMIGLGGQPVQPAWLAPDLNAEGAMGDARAASAEAGAALLDSAGRGLAEALLQFMCFDPAARHGERGGK